MDFSSLNPRTSNALNLAARNNDTKAVNTLLKKINPNCTDNRGWTCLHEAADKDSYDSLLLILQHPDCRPLAETHEGLTALYLACRKQCSLQTIRALVDSTDDIANYGSTEGVTPLHIASSQGRVELIQLLLEYGAMINVQDFDGDTPLHDAASAAQDKAVAVLLHAGADAQIKNEPSLLTPFHLACSKGSYQTVRNIFEFITDINELAAAGESPLMSAVKGCDNDVIKFLLQNGADPHIRNVYNQSALDMALNFGYITIFKILLAATDKHQINPNIILNACKPHYFKFEILEALLNHEDLGPEFFDFVEPFHVTLEKIGLRRPFYLTNAPLNSYLNICEYIYNQSPDKFREFFYLFLIRGVTVNAFDINECPPLVYIHYSMHAACFAEVFEILIENGLNVDYCSETSCSEYPCVPDAFMASLSSDLETASYMIPYSLCIDPETLLKFAIENGVAGRISLQAQRKLAGLIDEKNELVEMEFLPYLVPSLRHLCRLSIRSVLRKRSDIKSTCSFYNILNSLPLPQVLKKYLCYL